MEKSISEITAREQLAEMLIARDYYISAYNRCDACINKCEAEILSLRKDYV